MRVFLLAAMIAVSASAFAADPPKLTEGEMLRDAHNVRLGNIEQVNTDGTVDLIVDQQYVHVPISTITVTDGKAVTSLTKDQLTSAQ